MEASAGSAASVDVKDELMKSLTTFLQLYDQREAVLRQAAERFTQTATVVGRGLEACDSAVQGVLSFCGTCLGAVCGAVTGGLFGALGGAAAAAFTRLWDDKRAVDALAGFVGGVFGGTVGGGFSGAIGGLANSVMNKTRAPVYDVPNDLFWFSTGFVCGGVIGVVIGGDIGAAGGAMGAGYGALKAARVVDDLARGAANCSETIRSHKGEKQLGKGNEMQTAGEELAGSVRILTEELKTIQTLGDRLAPSEAMREVAKQTTTTLASARKMEEAMRECQAAENLAQFVSSVGEAATRCKKTLEGLKRTRAGVEELLVSLGGTHS